MIVTLDVSAALELIMGRKRQFEIKEKLEEADWIISPTLFIYEATNVMWKYHSLENLPQKELSRKLDYSLKLIDRFIYPEDIYHEAFSLAAEIDHPAYDAVYLTVTGEKKSTLLTLDEKLISAAEDIGLPVFNIEK